MHYKLSESIARATCVALVKLLDLLANAGLTKIAVRTTIHPDNVSNIKYILKEKE
jgi:MAD (mothers against decapentaplegic) interacting protein